MAAEANYQTALAAASAAKALAGQAAAATQVVAEAQRARDALTAAAVADAVQAQANLEVAVAAAAKTETELQSAQENLQRALATARWAADRVDSIQTELDGLPELNAAAEAQARTQVGSAATARSAAAVSVTAAQIALEAATASKDQPAINSAQTALLANQEVLEAAEAQLAAAELALEGVKADGGAQLADARNRLEYAEQLSWELGEHLMQADVRVRSANHNANTAADAVTRARAGVLTAQNLEGIAVADAALAAASAAAKTLHAQTTTSPDPASIDRLLRSAMEACAATSVDSPQAPAASVVAPAPATTVARQAPATQVAQRAPATPVAQQAPATPVSQEAPVGVPLADSGQKSGDVAGANSGLKLQTGVTPPAAEAPASPQGQGGLPVAAWSLGGLVVLAAASFGVWRGRLHTRVTNGSPSD